MTAGGLIFLGLAMIISAVILISVRMFQERPDVIRRLVRYAFIFAFVIAFCIVSVIIGFRISDRHTSSYSRSLKSVQEIWGGAIIQNAPAFGFPSKQTEQYEVNNTGELRTRVRDVISDHGFEAQTVSMKVKANIRKKGLLLFPGYDLEFTGKYILKNNLAARQNFAFDFSLPAGQGNITEIKALSDSKEFTGDMNFADGIQWNGTLNPGESREFSVSYKASGSKTISYGLAGKNAAIKNLSVRLETDFSDIDIPNNSMAPSNRSGDDAKSVLEWAGKNLVTGQNVSASFSIPGNYGEVVSKMFMYSPVAIILFTGFLLVFAVSLELNLHPMNYLFILAGYFIFYLFGSYIISYIPIIPAVLAALALSTALMLYYTKLINKNRQLTAGVAGGAGLFQWIFSVAFFFPEHTGFVITVASIGAFIALMKFTAKVDWENKW